MDENLSVAGFAGIDELEIAPGEITLLIGPQASGKSVCAKLLYYFRSFLKHLGAAVEGGESQSGLDARLTRTFHEYFPGETWGAAPFRLRYECGPCAMEVERRAGAKTVAIRYPDELRAIRAEAERVFADGLESRSGGQGNRLEAYRRATQSAARRVGEWCGPPLTCTQVFIPSGRSFYSSLQGSFFSLLSANAPIDPFVREFGSFYEALKGHIGKGLSSADDARLQSLVEFLENRAEGILAGQYVRDQGRDYLAMADQRRVPLENASSGQQEMLPLSLILGWLPRTGVAGEGYAVYIEEPEAHLFPSAQQQIVEMIAAVFNFSGRATTFAITTHSPYLPAAFNNLLLAGQIEPGLKKSQQARFAKIVHPQTLLKPGAMAAYSLENGTCRSILDNETGLIATNVIDEVSHLLSGEFGALLEYE